jgi:hypothetical protein
MRGDRPLATSRTRITLRPGMLWGEITSIAEAAGVPANATTSIIVDHNPTPTQFDPRAPEQIEFEWEIHRNSDHPGDV